MKNALLGKSNKQALQKSRSNSQSKSGRGKTTKVRWWHLLQWEGPSCLGMFPVSHLREFQSLPDQGWIDRDHLLAHYWIFSLLNSEPTNGFWHPEVYQLWAMSHTGTVLPHPNSLVRFDRTRVVDSTIHHIILPCHHCNLYIFCHLFY